MIPYRKPLYRPAWEPDRVRCLACRAIYSKPMSAHAPGAGANCPKCGHIGWLALSIPMDPPPPAQVSR